MVYFSLTLRTILHTQYCGHKSSRRIVTLFIKKQIIKAPGLCYSHIPGFTSRLGV